MALLLLVSLSALAAGTAALRWRLSGQWQGFTPRLAQGDDLHDGIALRLRYSSPGTMEGDKLVQPVAFDGLQGVTAMIDADRRALPVQLRVLDLTCV